MPGGRIDFLMSERNQVNRYRTDHGGGGTRGINLSIRPGISPSADPLGHTQVDIWQGTHCTGKTGKMVTKIPWQGKHRNLKMNLVCLGNLVFSSCKFPDSKGKRYFNICCKNSQKRFEAGYVYQVSLVYVIVTNHINWHRENLQSDREKSGKTLGI